MNHKCGTAKQRNLNANDIKERGNMEVKENIKEEKLRIMMFQEKKVFKLS